MFDVRRAGLWLALAAVVAGTHLGASRAPQAATENAAENVAEDESIALNLAELLRAARAVIAAKQDLINDPTGEDKGLTGEVVLDETVALFQK
ncbi:MAG: hypothetical protein ACREJ0_04155, partial [Geminicoccaceae bacterium]